MNIEDFAELSKYLCDRRSESAGFHVLGGGISNRTVLVQWQSGEAWVLKQALPKLRVASEWLSDPKRIHREAEALRCLGRWTPPGSITPLVFEDRQHDLVAMQAVAQPHENSPKNILIHADKLILLDHEVVHFGDPAFDIGFAMTHLLGKAHHLRPIRSIFCGAACEFWHTYTRAAGEVTQSPNFESRSIRHTLGCHLARVAGRSQLEYLDAIERQHQRKAALDLIHDMPQSIYGLVGEFERKLHHAEN